jgi:hypothetical protein
MLRLIAKLALASAVLAALWLWVPVRGRTLADRWDRAGSFTAFVERGWKELRGEPPKPAQERRSTVRSQARGTGASRARPTEGHTDTDKRELDRVLAEELSEHR